MIGRTRKSSEVFEFGFGLNGGTRTPEAEKVELCKKWLSENAKRKRVPKDECVSSYALKHQIENEIGNYIPNGACIQAAIDLGFEYWRDESSPSNAQFYLTLNSELPNTGKPSGFSKWLFGRGELYFCGDAALDPQWPRTATRFIDFWRYVQKYGEKNQEELCRAWKDYSGEDPPRPDLIDTELVYEEDCDFIAYLESYPKAATGTKYIYALVEVEDGSPNQFKSIRVKYVGQTDDPSKRLIDHILRPGDIDRVAWIGGLWAKKGKYPKMAVFCTIETDRANVMEQAAIYAFSERETCWNQELGGFTSPDIALLNKKHQKH